VGTVSNRRGFREEVLKIVLSRPDHPLRGILTPSNRLARSTGKGIDQDVWLEMPEMVEAGHAISAKSLGAAGQDRFMVMSAHHNRMFSRTVEHPGIGGSIRVPHAVDIGGVPLHEETARDLVAKKLLDPAVLAGARRISY
jgi:hypothetical protein